jgi:hypothetical protein
MLLSSTDAPHLRARQPVLLRELPLGLASAVLPAYVVVAARILAQLGVVVADDVGDGLGVAAEAIGDLGELEALGDELGNLFVKRVRWHGKMIAEEARSGKGSSARWPVTRGETQDWPGLCTQSYDIAELMMKERDRRM